MLKKNWQKAEMKDHSLVKQILSMRISKHRLEGIVKLSKLQGKVSLSTHETRSVAISGATKEMMIWLKNLLKELGKEQDDSLLYSNNQSVICLAKNSILYFICKSIELKYHCIRDLISDGDDRMQGEKT